MDVVKSAGDVLFFGHGSGEVKRVFTFSSHGAEHRSYLVNHEGSEVPVLSNAHEVMPDLEVGDRIEFSIMRISGSSGRPVLNFVRVDIAKEEEKWKKVMQAPRVPSEPVPMNKLYITEAGIYQVNGVAMSVEEFKDWLATPKAKSMHLQLFSHPESSFEMTIKALDLIKAAEITNVSFTADYEE